MELSQTRKHSIAAHGERPQDRHAAEEQRETGHGGGRVDLRCRDRGRDRNTGGLKGEIRRHACRIGERSLTTIDAEP